MSKKPEIDIGSMFDDAMGVNDKNLGIRGFLDTGIPELNYALSGNYRGGAPMGRLVEIFGPASCGKTFLSTMIMISAQKMGGVAAFSDHERSFEPNLAESLGLKMDGSFRYIRPDTFETSIKTAVNTCKKVRDAGFPMEKPLVWVFDSVASMIPHEKMYNDKGELREAGDYNMRDKLALASATSQNYPILAQFAEDNNMLVLLLNQIRTKPGVMYGDPTTTPGGNAAEFYASIRIQIGREEITNGKKGAEKEVLGFKIKAKIIKNKVARPFLTAEWQVRFNSGLGVAVDQVATNLDFLVRKGLMPRDGKYCVWEGKKYFQSVLETIIRDDPKGLEKLMAMVPETDDALPDVALSAALEAMVV